MSIEVLDDIKELAGLRDSWDNVHSIPSTPMQQYSWNLACNEAFLNNSELYVITSYSKSVLYAIAPLYYPRGFLYPCQMIGVNELMEPSDFIYHDLNSLLSITDFLAQKRTPLLLQRVPIESPTLVALKSSYRYRGIIVSNLLSNYPYIPLHTTWDNCESRLSNRLRSDIRRAHRKAIAIGEVKSNIYTPSSHSEVEKLFNEFLQIEASGWKGTSGNPLAGNPSQRAFFKKYCNAAHEAGILRFCTISIGGRIAAMQLAVVTNQRFWLLKICYVDTYENCSPGSLLTHETLRYAVESGLKSYEFLGSAEAWTRRWTLHERSSIQICAYPFTIKGFVLLFLDSSKRLYRKIHFVFSRP